MMGIKEELAQKAENTKGETKLIKSMSIADLIKAMESEIRKTLPEVITPEQFTNEGQLTADEILSDHAYYFDLHLTLKQIRCQNCVSLTEKAGIWYCDEMQKPVEEIECCPEGVEIPERNM